MKIRHISREILLFFLFLSACSSQKPVSSLPSQSQNLEPTTNKVLTICLGEEPESLFLYSAKSHAAQLIRQAIYDGPFDMESDNPQAIILEKMPNFKDGSAFFSPVEVTEGDLVINSIGEVVTLQPGVEVFPAGCSSHRCAEIWDGISPLLMSFITVEYKLKPGIKWSDGQPLIASDSAYSYQLATELDARVSNESNGLIATYSAIDDLTVRWTSKPGLVTEAFEEFFYTPLPEHVWGKYKTENLLAAEEVNRKPIGWGAYQIDDWIEGQSLHLSKNPYYFRKDENLPNFDELVFKFINPYGDTAVSNLKFDRRPFQQFNYDLGEFEKEIADNGCDLTTTTSDLRDQLPVLNILQNYFKDPAVKIFKSGLSDVQIIFFNLDRQENGLPSPSADPNVRKAVDLCLNRSRMTADLSFGLYEIVDLSMLMNSGEITEIQATDHFNPVSGRAFLDQSGWLDADNNPETPRISSGIPGIIDGKELGFRYFVEDIDDNLKSSEIVKASLEDCGIGVNIKAVPTEIFWNANNTDSVFQGNYDLAQLSWATPITDPCPMFSSDHIPSIENDFKGLNFSKFRNEDFDTLCVQYKKDHLESDRKSLIRQMDAIITDNLPVLPLYRYSKMIAAQRDFCTEPFERRSINELSKVEEFRISPDCR